MGLPSTVSASQAYEPSIRSTSVVLGDRRLLIGAFRCLEHLAGHDNWLVGGCRPFLAGARQQRRVREVAVPGGEHERGRRKLRDGDRSAR